MTILETILGIIACLLLMFIFIGAFIAMHFEIKSQIELSKIRGEILEKLFRCR